MAEYPAKFAVKFAAPNQRGFYLCNPEIEAFITVLKSRLQSLIAVGVASAVPCEGSKATSLSCLFSCGRKTAVIPPIFPCLRSNSAGFSKLTDTVFRIPNRSSAVRNDTPCILYPDDRYRASAVTLFLLRAGGSALPVISCFQSSCLHISWRCFCSCRQRCQSVCSSDGTERFFDFHRSRPHAHCYHGAGDPNWKFHSARNNPGSHPLWISGEFQISHFLRPMRGIFFRYVGK